MGFLTKGCGELPLKPKDDTRLVINEYGIVKEKIEPKRTSKEALEMAKKSAANNKGVDLDVLANYSWSGERVKTQDEKNYETLKKGGLIK